jgi:predicted MPP superfamily phosphohydrolase
MSHYGDMPTFANSAATSSTFTVADGTLVSGTTTGLHYGDVTDAYKRQFMAAKFVGNQSYIGNGGATMSRVNEKAIASEVKNKLRVVRVFLVDPDERLPVESRILHKTEELITDATDQELFFGIPVASLLEGHNKLRASTEWEQRGKTKKGLKEIRIRDLVMSVTTLAEFSSRPVAEASDE